MGEGLSVVCKWFLDLFAWSSVQFFFQKTLFKEPLKNNDNLTQYC